MGSKINFPKSEEDFNQWLVSEYFKEGSVEAVYRKYRFEIPVSYAQYQRILDKWGVVKAVGPNSKLAGTIDFFACLVKENIPFAKLYSKMPPSFHTSAKTLYRILSYIKEGITRRVGVALLITPCDNREKILVARDVSAPRIELGKFYGALSLPMGFARRRDLRRTNILRILQNEVFTKKVIKKNFPFDIIPVFPEPFMYLDIADVRVSVYHLQLPRFLSNVRNFSSYKLKNYSFWDLSKILDKNTNNLIFRAGVYDIALGYKKYLELLDRNLVVNPLQSKSLLNKEVAVEVDLEF